MTARPGVLSSHHLFASREVRGERLYFPFFMSSLKKVFIKKLMKTGSQAHKGQERRASYTPPVWCLRRVLLLLLLLLLLEVKLLLLLPVGGRGVVRLVGMFVLRYLSDRVVVVDGALVW